MREHMLGTTSVFTNNTTNSNSCTNTNDVNDSIGPNGLKLKDIESLLSPNNEPSYIYPVIVLSVFVLLFLLLIYYNYYITKNGS